MSRQRFQRPAKYGPSELFLIGGRDQQQVELEPAQSQTPEGKPIHAPYARADAAIESMAEGGYDFSDLTTTLKDRDERVGRISKEVLGAEGIEASRRRVADAFNGVDRASVRFKTLEIDPSD